MLATQLETDGMLGFWLAAGMIACFGCCFLISMSRATAEWAKRIRLVSLCILPFCIAGTVYYYPALRAMKEMHDKERASKVLSLRETDPEKAIELLHYYSEELASLAEFFCLKGKQDLVAKCLQHLPSDEKVIRTLAEKLAAAGRHKEAYDLLLTHFPKGD